MAAVNPVLDAFADAPAELEQLADPMPIDSAISPTSGIEWSEVDEHLMLRRLPGTFVAGEMLDWEAPTGGYLL